MKIFAVYTPAVSHLVGIWLQSWTQHGWEPRLITEREVLEHGSVNAAVKHRLGRIHTDCTVINFDFDCPRGYPRRLRAVAWGSPSWDKARLVRFPENISEEGILRCGRSLS